MSAAASKLNLRPQERRLIVLVAIVLFVVLNVWLVWPLFGDWGRYQMNQLRARRTLDTYRSEIAKVSGYRVKLRELENAGPSVVLDEQELDLVRTVQNQATINRLYVITSDPRPRVSANSQTNRFFEEQYQNLHVTAGNEELINFLVSLTSTNSLIRVKDLSVKPDTSGTKLDSQMTLVASYQRTTPAKVSPTSSPRPSDLASAKPAIPPTRVVTSTNKTTPILPAGGGAATNRFTSSKPRQGTNTPAKKP